MARTHHEVVELRGPGHELGPTHRHTDFHEACMLAGLGLPHLTHDPAERRGQTPWGHRAVTGLPVVTLSPILCNRISGMGRGRGERHPGSFMERLLLGSQEMRKYDLQGSPGNPL